METPTARTHARPRRGRTRTGVRLADVAARWVITVGGVGTIAAVCTVFFFLLWEVWPLLAGTSLRPKASYVPPQELVGQGAVRLVVDEYQTMGLAVEPDGRWTSFALRDGKVLGHGALIEGGPDSSQPGASITAVALAGTGGGAVAGLSDGSIRLGKVGFVSSFLASADVPAELADLPVGETAVLDGGVVERTPEGQHRLKKLSITFSDPVQVESSAAVVMLDYVTRPTGPMVALMTADGRVAVEALREKRDLMAGKTTYQVTRAELPALPGDFAGERPLFLGLTGLGDNLLLVWADGRMLRYDVRSLSGPRLVEKSNLLAYPGAVAGTRITAVRFELGRTTLMVGDGTGRIHGWFLVETPQNSDGDRHAMTLTRRLAEAGPAVTALAISARQRIVAAGFADGSVRIIQGTTGETLARGVVGDGKQAHAAVAAMVISPKDDGLLALARSGHDGADSATMQRWSLQVTHPEATLRSLFGAVWYEKYDKPGHIWQSSAGTDDAEPKLGMMPLVFGTLKATFYSMLFAVPLALLAAVYTSEFLHPNVRARIKPTIELMASLPSVVLGFLAALVIAPYAERMLPTLLAAGVLAPVTLVVASCLWQMLPHGVMMRLPGAESWRFGMICLTLPVAVAMSAAAGPVVERMLFGGNIRLWLDGQGGTGLGGWVVLLLPGVGVLSALGVGWLVNPWIRHLPSDWDRSRCAMANGGKVLAILVLAGVATLLAAWCLTAAGLDPRGPWVIGPVDWSLAQTYVQRNALIVGFVMGFAIIPIIYTIADDALTAVPEHLRSASLGAGATPWQTTVRIIIPTATSGLFSAIMVGLGRAVGETM
ncbi:MAG: ABC transporter permease subunit, partial [Phycisphaeraceae bacterium]|nr:ABC transporter permease subunit [Phycisphaeraceae bacterium]